MFYRFLLWLRDGRNRLWVKPALGSMFAIAFALLATLADRFLPVDALPSIEKDTIDGILSVIASSMLAVTTFSLSILVAAFSSVSQGASPRATELVMADDDTQNAIAAFISAFIFSVIAKTALGLGYYGPGGRFVLFSATVIVLLYLIYTLVMWVRTLSSLGRMGNTLAKLEKAATEAMLVYRRAPHMGAKPQIALPADGTDVVADQVGHVRYIDMKALQGYAAEHDLQLHLRVRPGAQVYPGSALLRVQGPDGFEPDRLRDAFVVGPARTYQQDPRFGIVVLSEVAQRALSPAVNDPGTAIAAMNTITRVLIDARPGANGDDGSHGDASDEFDRLTMPALDEGDFVEQGFGPISRDGASILEVHIRMQKVLAAIADSGSVTLEPAARRQALTDLRRAEQALTLDEEKRAVHAVFESLHGSVGPSA